MIKIPLIGSDLRFDEVTIRAIKTFEYLDTIVDDIFNRIDARIDRNMVRISHINTRLEKASEKIERLKQSRKAIKMFSPARYPIETAPKFHPTFDSTFEPRAIDFNYRLDLPLERTEHKQYADKLQFFHLKSPRPQVPDKKSLVFTTSSINALITFVNGENLYLKETAAKSREREQQQPEPKHHDDTTDFSRFSSMIRAKQHGDNFHYLPSLTQAPEFEFPLDLPDLEGIAGDISFSVPDEELLEPSFRSMNIVNELPNVAELIEVKAAAGAAVVAVNASPAAAPPPPPAAVLSSLPPPPPPPPIPVNVPMPPPPPPAVASGPSIPAPPVDDARSSLMKAIRDAAGKAKLKSVPAADEQVSDKVAKKKVVQAPAMDLMSDLHQKLMLRRKGIAGSKEAKKEKSSSIMGRVSSLIPPPPKRGESDSDSDSESANDEDDWN
jgi:WAS family protein 1